MNYGKYATTDPRAGSIRFGQPGAWICPRCGTVNAWWVAHCNCKPPQKNPRGRP